MTKKRVKNSTVYSKPRVSTTFGVKFQIVNQDFLFETMIIAIKSYTLF